MIKKGITLLLGFCLIVGMLSVFATAEDQRYFGIDVSHHQGQINWDAVAPNIDFAIIRCGYGDDLTNQDDRQWKANADACTRLGIPFGVYLYSYALTDAQALSEAEHVLRLVEGYDPSLPIYLDLEENKILASCSKEDILRHAQIFCDRIEQDGYEVGIYANYNWWTNYLTSSTYDQWDRWIARYASATGYSKDYTIWQYSESGSVSGISGNVDLNYWYGELPGSECDHNYSSEVTKESTCTTEGIKTFICKYCSDSYIEPIAVKGHDYQSTVVKPTCVQNGFTTHRCSQCSDEYKDSIKPATGHSFSDRICSICGINESASILGDINYDGSITSADAVLLARYLVDMQMLTEQQLLAADLDGDGSVTSADAVMMAKLLVGK